MYEENIKEIIKDLEFIASIPKSYKPCFSDKSLIYSNEWFVKMKRRWKGEQGERGVIYVNNVLDRIGKNCKNFNIDYLKNIKKKLRESILGINNLVYTYKIDGQEDVAKSYEICNKYIEKLISILDNCIKDDMKKINFFSYSPKIIS